MFKRVVPAALVAAAFVPAVAFAQSVVDYASIATEVTDQFGAALTAAAVLVGLILGAKIGWSFVKRMLGK